MKKVFIGTKEYLPKDVKKWLEENLKDTPFDSEQQEIIIEIID